MDNPSALVQQDEDGSSAATRILDAMAGAFNAAQAQPSGSSNELRSVAQAAVNTADQIQRALQQQARADEEGVCTGV